MKHLFSEKPLELGKKKIIMSIFFFINYILGKTRS